MVFKKLRGVNIPAKKQLLIRAICLNYDDRPKWEQKKIERLCDMCGGGYSAALFEAMTTEKSKYRAFMRFIRASSGMQTTLILTLIFKIFQKLYKNLLTNIK